MERTAGNMINSMKIFSIESRKGGVGKTTIALNLAQALVEDGYDVLLIDCDITGTPITKAACNSRFWKSLVSPLNLYKNEGNLIKYFEDVYLKGESVVMGVINEMKIKKGNIHLIGSEIYGNDGKLVIDPRLLMDDLHSHWFVEMLKEICDIFYDKSESKNKAVILDNSPGYVGIGKSIRNWLTSLGGDFAHFVLVSSLDEQDVESTISSAVDIERTMSNKWKIVNLRNQIFNNKGNSNELTSLLDSSQEYKEFFYSLEGNERIYLSNIQIESELKRYVSILFNKVPKIYHDITDGYDFKDDEEERKKIVEKLIPLDNRKMPQNIIEYDASISGQFIESHIMASEVDEERTKALYTAREKFLKNIREYKNSYDKVNQLSSLNRSFISFKKELIKLGYKPLVDSMDNDFDFQDYVQDIITSVKSWSQVSLNGRADRNSIDMDKYHRVHIMLEEYLREYGYFDNYNLFSSLFDSLYSKAGINRQSANSTMINNLSLLLELFIEVLKKESYEKISLYQILFDNYNVSGMRANAIGMIDWPKFSSMNSEEWNYKESQLKEVLDTFCSQMYYILLRLIDGADDYNHILDACMTSINRGERTMDSDLKDYCRSVMIWKTVVFKQTTFTELLEKPFEMRIVKDALKKYVLK